MSGIVDVLINVSEIDSITGLVIVLKKADVYKCLILIKHKR